MNHYEVLEIHATATQGEIKESYRRLAKQYHPDRRTGGASHDKIIVINAAYEVLGDPKRRTQYDQELNPSQPRISRQKQAQQHYRHRRHASKSADENLSQWLILVYVPLERDLGAIIRSLELEIDHLAADPFDDELMSAFQAYLANCRLTLQRARRCFTSQSSPAALAKVAAFLYYCLNHLDDAMEELELFTLNYDEASLTMGKEMFRLAEDLLSEAAETMAGLQA